MGLGLIKRHSVEGIVLPTPAGECNNTMFHDGARPRQKIGALGESAVFSGSVAAATLPCGS